MYSGFPLHNDIARQFYIVKISVCYRSFWCKLTPFGVNLTPVKAPVTLSRFKPRFTTTHPDLRQMVKSGCIWMRRDGKKKFQHQYDVSRCSYGVCTIHLRIHYDSRRQRYDSPRWSCECSRLLTMHPRFDTVLVRFKPVELR